MRTSIATVCLSGGLSEKLSAIAAAGFRTVEIFESDRLRVQLVQPAQRCDRIVARPVITDAREVPVEIDTHAPPFSRRNLAQ